MFEQDYIMRLIREMVRMILKLVFHIDTESPVAELLEDREAKNTLEELLDMVDAGNINEAENRLSDILQDRSMDNLEMALLFYSYLNDQTDDFLETHDFSREEVQTGLERLVADYGLGGMAEAFRENE